MRLRLAALLIPCLALGGCISRGDGSILEVLLVDEGAPQVAGVVIGAGANPAPSDTQASAPLPPPRPPEFGGVLLASADNDANIEEYEVEDDEPASSAALNGSGPFQWLASLQGMPPQAAPTARPQTAQEHARTSKGPGFFAAYAYTQVNCFPQELKTALDTIAAHYNKPVEVASGHRPNGRRGSMHRHCMAADIRIDGVEPMAIATYAKTVPGINGVGSYRNTDLIHVDVRQEQFAWRR
jgi:hypothetical protein